MTNILEFLYKFGKDLVQSAYELLTWLNTEVLGIPMWSMLFGAGWLIYVAFVIAHFINPLT